jgi:hypothetical protein
VGAATCTSRGWRLQLKDEVLWRDLCRHEWGLDVALWPNGGIHNSFRQVGMHIKSAIGVPSSVERRCQLDSLVEMQLAGCLMSAGRHTSSGSDSFPVMVGWRRAPAACAPPSTAGTSVTCRKSQRPSGTNFWLSDRCNVNVHGQMHVIHNSKAECGLCVTNSNITCSCATQARCDRGRARCSGRDAGCAAAAGPACAVSLPQWPGKPHVALGQATHA